MNKQKEAGPGTIRLTPIEGGFHVKDLDNGLCVDLMLMIFNWRIVRSDQGHNFHDRGWCYEGIGSETLLRAAGEAQLWDGADDTEPEGWIKRVIDVPGKGKAGMR